jgi:signal transduction histidine kinase
VRLSRELHDTLLQSLVGVALQLETIASDKTLGAIFQTKLLHIRKQIDRYMSEARQSIWQLRTPALETSAVTTVLQRFAEQATTEKHIALEFRVVGTPLQLPDTVEEEILRIGQEAVLNAVRHARPTNVRVEFVYDVESLTLRVSDNGVGLGTDAASAVLRHHYGLAGMEERAEAIGGTCTIRSQPGIGTEVNATIPLSPPHGLVQRALSA